MLILSNQRAEYEAEQAKQLVRVSHKINTSLFVPFIGFISTNALNKLYEQLELSRCSDFPSECACTTTLAMGILCGHVVQAYALNHQSLRLNMIHRYWYFHPDQAPEYLTVSRQLLDLLPVCIRGHPPGSTSTRRDASHWEFLEQNLLNSTAGLATTSRNSDEHRTELSLAQSVRGQSQSASRGGRRGKGRGRAS